MIASWMPVKWIAGAAALAGALLLGAPAALIEQPLARLEAARTLRAQQTAMAALPIAPPRDILAPGDSFMAADREAAIRSISMRVRQAATETGVLVERLTLSGGEAPERPIRIDLAASGKEDAVLRFADRLRRARPLVVLKSWSVGGTGPIRIEGQALAAWTRRG